MESSNFILSVSLDDALALCKRGEFVTARDRVIVVKGLFDRLAVRSERGSPGDQGSRIPLWNPAERNSPFTLQLSWIDWPSESL